MVGKERAFESIKEAFASSRADMTEIVLISERDSLTRFANSEIHQNTSVDDVTIMVRAIDGTREGWASTNQLTPEALADAAARALEMASVQPANPDFPGLAEPAQYEDAHGYDETTAAFGPMERAEAVQSIIRQADAHKLNASGALRTRVREIAVANTLGVCAWHVGTDASLVTVVMESFEANAGSGYAEAGAMRVGDLDFQALGARAVDKCIASMNPVAIEPGEFVAVLEPSAVSTAMEMLAYMGMNGLSFTEGRSYASGRLGAKVTSEMVTIIDDWRHPRMAPLPFDFEGVPRKRVPLIQNGLAAGVVFDRAIAARAHTKSTGHAVPGGEEKGGYPIHLAMATGISSVEEMVAETERGVYVTRFNYVNPVHPTKTIITGMTKDGTFLIENGRITKPLRNLRFTESILDGILGSVQAISREAELIPALGDGGLYSAPAIKTGRLNFTGASA
ncbi:MAG: TldD/PmbA family protein [Clostridia bacterium]|nr:TldD/PmbA family protein [Clostridia bacterium]